MRDNGQHNHRTDGLTVLLLFAVFAVCILLVLLLGLSLIHISEPTRRS